MKKRTFELNDADEAALLAAIAEADRGEALNADEVLVLWHASRGLEPGV